MNTPVWGLASLIALLVCSASAYADDVRVVDGDTILIGKEKIRLWGIDAPEPYQKCERNGVKYLCGAQATSELRRLIRGRTVTCNERDRDRYGRSVSVCKAGSTELNRSMVRRGWAIDYTRYSRGRYRMDEKQARRLRSGLWRGRFVRPEEWRRGKRLD